MHIASTHCDPQLYVTAIDDKAFNGCTNLTNVVFCDEIEEFVSAESIRGWWIQGVH
jgi:hypothetical protein